MLIIQDVSETLACELVNIFTDADTGMAHNTLREESQCISLRGTQLAFLLQVVYCIAVRGEYDAEGGYLRGESVEHIYVVGPVVYILVAISLHFR